jgi:hypothetical protein
MRTQPGMTLLLALVAFAVPALAAKPSPDFDVNAAPAQNASVFLKAGKLNGLAGVKRVAITNFRVEFAMSNTGKSSSSFNGVTMTRSDITLTGVSDEDRRDIADQLHARFVRELTDAGFEVVPYDEVKANASYQSLGPVLRDTQDLVGTQGGKSIFIGPRGMPVYMSNDDKHLSLGSALGGFSTTQPQNIEPRIAESLNAAVLRVTMAVDFAEFKARGGMFASKSSVQGNIGLAMLPELTQILVVLPQGGRARIALDTGVALQSNALTVQETTTRGSKVAQGLGNALVMLSGKGATQSLKKFEAIADPKAYAEAITQYGGAVHAAAVSLMKTAAGR